MRIPSGDLAPARKHRRYGGGYGRSRRRKGPALLAVLLVLVGVGAAYLLQRNDAGAPARRTLTQCTPAPRSSAAPSRAAAPSRPVALPRPRQVRLILLNGTNRNGLGRSVGNQLAARGFVVSGTGNAKAPLGGPSRVSYGPGARPAGTLVANQVDGATLVGVATMKPGSVGLVLGSGFARLRTPAEAAALARAPVPAPAAAATRSAAPPSACG